jgi:hypothetical protein
MNAQHDKQAQGGMAVEKLETAVNEILLACKINERPKRTKVKAGIKLHFPLMDATAPDEQFERDKAECERVIAKVQTMLDRSFPGCRAEREKGRAYPQSNTFFKITITWPPAPPAPAVPPGKPATNIDQWLTGKQNSIERQPGEPETLPPTWHYIVIQGKQRPWLAWVVIGPQSRITSDLLQSEIQNKTGLKVEVSEFTNYGPTYKPRTRWLIANGFITDLTGKLEARQREQEKHRKQPPNRKPVVPSSEAIKAWLNRSLPHEYRKRDEPEILPDHWKRLSITFDAEGTVRTVDWLVIEERPQRVKVYRDLVLVDLEDVLGTTGILIKRMKDAGKEYIPAARALMKHGFYTDVPMAEIERRKALAILNE